MQLWEAQKLCPEIILVNGDSEKYLECTKRFLNILKDYSPYLEVFSIDEVFLELESSRQSLESRDHNLDSRLLTLATGIKSRIRSEIGEWITCSIGISYNKLMAKLAGSLKKPDGLIIIPDQETAIKVLDRCQLDDICGIGYRIKQRLFNMGVTNFPQLRAVPKEALQASFKSYGLVLYNMARGIDERPIVPFYEKPEVKSIGHRHTIFHDTKDLEEIKQIFLKLTELIARKLRAKRLVGRTVSCWFRYAIDYQSHSGLSRILTLDSGVASLPRMTAQKPHFEGGGMPASTHYPFVGQGGQITIPYTDDGLEIFNAAWKVFHQIWNQEEEIRMVGVSISNLKPALPETISLLEETHQKEIITKALDKINDKYGEFTLQRGILLTSAKISRKPNSFLADRRFKL